MRIFVTISLMLFASLSYADICKWKDENGQFRFGNQAPKGYNAQCVQSVESIEPDKHQTRIISWEAQEVTDSRVLFAVKYYYDGVFGDVEIRMTAQTLQNGKATMYYSYKPVVLKKGENIALMSVGIASHAPKKYCSNGVKFEIYGKNISTIHKATIDYSHCWINKNASSAESKPSGAIK